MDLLKGFFNKNVDKIIIAVLFLFIVINNIYI